MTVTNSKLYLALFFSIFLVSCSMIDSKQGETQAAYKSIKHWENDTVYKSGQYVQSGGNIFRSTTATRNVAPVRENFSGAQNPLGAWVRSSISEFQRDQEKFRNRITMADLSGIRPWDASAVYHGGDLVKISDGTYYHNIWWNQNNNPKLDIYKNNYTDSEGTTHWGPWASVTAERALEILKDKQEGVQPPAPEENTEVGTTRPPVIDPPTGEVSPEDIERFAWNKDAVYVENDLATVSENGITRFFRSKWWNQNSDPLTPYEFAWDSPWEEISESLFNEILQDGGVTPPTSKPDPDPNPDEGGKPPTTPEMSEIYAQGYIQEWSWDELPQKFKDAFNKGSLNKLDIFASRGDIAVSLFTRQINQEKWNLLFPRRRGSAGWEDENPGETAADYYSFENFVEALRRIGDYAYLIEVALDAQGKETPHFQKNYILHKPSGTVRLISQASDYFAPNNDWLTGRPHKLKVVDYAAFGSEGSDNDKVRVIAGFLAHASHETSGSWATAPGASFDKNKFPSASFPDYITTELPGLLAWSLYFNEEVAYAGTTGAHYVDPQSLMFPPTPGKSYHGRGAFQLSWNYNYGLASAIFFGTSKFLLDKPEFIVTGGTVDMGWTKGERIEGGTMAFLTSLMFWLTPQSPKPSQQDSMILNRNDGKYFEGTAKLVKQSRLGTPGYGWTINIMNGGFEAGKSWESTHPKYDAKVERRVKHYLFFTQALGGNNDGEVLDTVGLNPY